MSSATMRVGVGAPTREGGNLRVQEATGGNTDRSKGVGDLLTQLGGGTLKDLPTYSNQGSWTEDFPRGMKRSSAVRPISPKTCGISAR